MVKIEVNDRPTKKEISFPKLMVGKNTGAIYLALGRSAGSEILTILLHPTAKNDNMLGYRCSYPSYLLQDFNGSITIRNEQ